MFSKVLPLLRHTLTPAAALEVAKVHLKNARETENSEVALTFCGEAVTAMSRIGRSARRALVSSSRVEDRRLCSEIAATYIELGELLHSLGSQSKAKACYVNVEKWGGSIQEPGQSSPRCDKVMSPRIADHNADTHANLATNPTSDTTANAVTVQTSSLPITPSSPSSPSLSTSPSSPLSPSLSSPLSPLPSSPWIQESRTGDIAPITRSIFAKDMHQPPEINKLPRIEERLESISQLVRCLELLQSSHSPENPLDQTERNWLDVTEHDPDEQERLKMIATNLLREFAREELKDAKAVAEIVCLVPVLDKDELQQLLQQLFHGIEQSKLLDFNLLEGLAQLVQCAVPGHLHADDMVKILELISTRLRDTHQQSSDYIYQLTFTVSRVLDAMADSRVKGLNREQLHAPLAAYLRGLESNNDPYLIYQAAYASQALLYVPDDETPWQATVRRTGKVVKGVSGLVSAVKGLDLNQFVEGLSHIQEGLAGASEVLTLVKGAYEDVDTLNTNGQQFLSCLKEGFSFSRKRAWYPALRCADILLRNGQLIEFQRLVYEAPCRNDPAFQWGICLRLGELAANTECDDDSRTSAVEFLGEMYRNDAVWGYQASIKLWILDILVQLTTGPGRATQAETLLQELGKDENTSKQALYRLCQEKGPGPHSLKFVLPPPTSPSLLDRVQNKVVVETTLRQLKERRLRWRGESVYISPQAKASLQASNDALFPLMNKAKEFLDSDQKVFLLLGDSGAGKSTFNRQLEYDLWNGYKKMEGRIPLFITLAAITNPEDELIAKQLKKEGFTEPQIRELKGYREFILICDGYDESRQTHNLYTSNRMNQLGEWRAQMVVSCRSEYLGIDYRDQFQPVDRNHQAELPLFQQAVITPFSKDQIEDYVNQFVSVKGPLWQASDYMAALDRIPSLKDLVTNPFLLALSLEVLPRMVDPGQSVPTTRVTRVALYDQFVELWLERGKKRLIEKVSDRERKSFTNLSDEGFTQEGIGFLKRLATAIFDHQAGNSVVEYSSVRDKGTWKDAFFSHEDEKKLLREACPLSRSGNQYKFLHRSLLEYSLARAVFDPQEGRLDELRTAESTITASRRGSFSSAFSFEFQGTQEDMTVAIEQSILESPIGRRNFVGEPSILRFLVERVQQEPLFKKRLLAVIERSKTEQMELESARSAAANAITILVRAGVQFNGADLRGIQIPGADLSHGVFDCAQLQGADMRKVTLRSAWLRGADMSNAQMAGVQFGELPFLEEDSKVTSCAYSPDAETFVVSLLNGNISIYTTSSWEKVWVLRGHSERVWSVAYSPNGDLIASCSDDMTVRLWDVVTGDCHHTLSGHSGWVRCVAYSPNGDQIASGSDDTTVRLWDVETGHCRRTLSGHSDNVVSIAYSPKGDQIVSGSSDKTVRVWDIETGCCCHTISGHSLWVTCVAYSPAGGEIASGSEDFAVRLWDVETGNCRQTLSGHSNWVRSIAYSAKGDEIASGSDDFTVRLWVVETGDCHRTLSGHSSWVRSIVYSPAGDQIASGSDDKTVRLWDVGTEDSRHTLSGHSDWIWNVAFSPKVDQIASGSEDKTVRLWDTETGYCRHTLRGHCDNVVDIAYSPKGDRIASGSYDTTVRLWDVETGHCRHILSGHSEWVRNVVYSPKGDQIASVSDDKTVRLWDVETGDCRHTLSGHGRSVQSVAFSPKSDQIASGSRDTTVRLWDVETGDCRHILSGHSDNVVSIAFSPEGLQIASGSDDNTVRLWDVETGDCCHTLIGHSWKVMVVIYSPDGDQIASGSRDSTVRLWDVETGDCCYTLSGHDGWIRSIVYSPEGDQVASGNDDCTVRIWDVMSGQCQVTIQNYAEVKSIDWGATSNGNCLVVGCKDGSVLSWRVMEESNDCSVRLHWRSTPDALTLDDTSIQDVRGLSLLNKQLLKQRGAVGEPNPL